MLSSIILHLKFLRLSLLLSLELINLLGWLALMPVSSKALWVSLSPELGSDMHHCTWPFTGTWDLNLDLHACVASALLNEPFLQPSIVSVIAFAFPQGQWN